MCHTVTVSYYLANTRLCENVGLLFAQHRRRWANIKPTLFQHRISVWYTQHIGLVVSVQRKTSENHINHNSIIALRATWLVKKIKFTNKN